MDHNSLKILFGDKFFLIKLLCFYVTQIKKNQNLYKNDQKINIYSLCVGFIFSYIIYHQKQTQNFVAKYFGWKIILLRFSN